MDWSLLGCGARGHVTFAPDEPGLRDRFGYGAARDGQAWRCLRCGAFVIGEPTASGPADSAPRVRRGQEVRSALILRIFAVERFIRALVFAALAIAIWRFSVSRLSLEQSYDHALPPLKTLLRDLGFSVEHSKVLGLINKAFTTDPRILAYLAIGCAAYAAVEVIEGVGLWLVKRWGEYFAMIATSVGLPFEIYDLTNKVTALRAVAFADQPGPGPLPGADQAPVRRARRQGSVRGPAAQRVHPGRRDRRPGRRAPRGTGAAGGTRAACQAGARRRARHGTAAAGEPTPAVRGGPRRGCASPGRALRPRGQ